MNSKLPEIFFSFGRNSRDGVAFCGQTGKPSCARLTGLSRLFLDCNVPKSAKIWVAISFKWLNQSLFSMLTNQSINKKCSSHQSSTCLLSSEAPCWNFIFQVEKTGILETSCQATADMACPKPSSDAQPSLPEVCKLKWYAIVWWSFRKIWMALIFSFPKVQLWPLPKSC